MDTTTFETRWFNSTRAHRHPIHHNHRPNNRDRGDRRDSDTRQTKLLPPHRPPPATIDTMLELTLPQNGVLLDGIPSKVDSHCKTILHKLYGLPVCVGCQVAARHLGRVHTFTVTRVATRKTKEDPWTETQQYCRVFPSTTRLHFAPHVPIPVENTKENMENDPEKTSHSDTLGEEEEFVQVPIFQELKSELLMLVHDAMADQNRPTDPRASSSSSLSHVPRGVLLHGGLGCGKSTLVAQMCQQVQQHSVANNMSNLSIVVRTVSCSTILEEIQSSREKNMGNSQGGGVPLLDAIVQQGLQGPQRTGTINQINNPKRMYIVVLQDLDIIGAINAEEDQDEGNKDPATQRGSCGDALRYLIDFGETFVRQNRGVLIGISNTSEIKQLSFALKRLLTHHVSLPALDTASRHAIVRSMLPSDSTVATNERGMAKDAATKQEATKKEETTPTNNTNNKKYLPYVPKKGDEVWVDDYMNNGSASVRAIVLKEHASKPGQWKLNTIRKDENGQDIKIEKITNIHVEYIRQRHSKTQNNNSNDQDQDQGKESEETLLSTVSEETLRVWKHIVDRTGGYIMNDFVRLLRHIRLQQRTLIVATQSAAVASTGTLTNNSSAPTLENIIETSLDLVRPSSLDALNVRVPTITFNNIGGYATVKNRLRKTIEWQWSRTEVMARMGIASTSGVLLHGPTGCGKTMFAEALAHECRCNFVSVRLHDIFSPFLGESESYLRHLFRTARNATPCMLFLDDLDVIATKRDLTGGSGGNGGSGGSNSVGGRVLATLLNEMDGIESNEGVVVVGATNSIDDVDPALIRPGRLDVTVLIHAPTAMDRIDMFQKLTATTPLDDDVDVQLVGQLTEGWNGTWFVV